MPNYKSLNEQGYFVMDQLLQIIVIGAVTTLLLFYTTTVSTFLRATETHELQQYDQYWLELTELVHSASSVRQHFSTCSLIIETTSGLYRYDKLADRIRKTKDGLGYEPVLMKIESCTYRVNGNLLTATVKFTSGLEVRRETLLREAP